MNRQNTTNPGAQAHLDPFQQGSRHPKWRPAPGTSSEPDRATPFGETEAHLENAYALALRIRLTLLDSATPAKSTDR